MKSTTKTTAVGKRPPAKTAKAEVKKGGKKADFSMLAEIKKEEQRAADVMAGKATEPAPGAMTKEVFSNILDDRNDPTHVEFVPEATVIPSSATPAGITVIHGGKKKRGAGIEPAFHPREDVTTQIQQSIKKAVINPPVSRIAPQPATQNVNKRITPGTPINEWRVVKSLRAEFKGWFLQGGMFKPGPRGNQFFVGAEERYLELAAAKEALKNKRVA